MNRRLIKTKGKRLLVINFVTDADDPVLGFAVEWICEIARTVDQLVVLTGRLGRASLPQNAMVVCTGWREDQNIRNVFRFLRQLFKVLYHLKPQSAFTHMALVQGVLASPFLRLLRIRHVLWYVHIHNSIMLKIGHRLVDQIVTSSAIGFPIQSPKLSVIGHGIRGSKGGLRSSVDSSIEFVHWGRCDPIKRIDYLRNVVHQLNSKTGAKMQLIVIGDPSSSDAEASWRSIIQSDLASEFPVLRWERSRLFTEISESLKQSMIFLHACLSGVDKAPLEASIMGIPVLSENPSVRQALGESSSSKTLLEQVEAFLAMSDSERQNLTASQHNSVVEHHSINTLGERLGRVLFPGEIS